MAGQRGGFRQAITAHVEAHWGPAPVVFHELVSGEVAIDVLGVPPSRMHPFQTLVTLGMSDRPMHVPSDAAGCELGELVLSLPPSWPLDELSAKEEVNWWPVRWLKKLARLPHEEDSWLFCGHTIADAEPPEPLVPHLRFCGWLLATPVLAGEECGSVAVDSTATVYLHSLIPLYPEGLAFAREHGPEALMDRLAAAGVSELLDVHRPAAC